MRRMLLGMCLLLLASCGGAAVSSPSLTNTSTATHFKIGQQVGLHTSDGTNNQPFATSSPNPATVTAGAATEGAIIYEVPATAKTFTLTFASGRDVTATWDVSV